MWNEIKLTLYKIIRYTNKARRKDVIKVKNPFLRLTPVSSLTFYSHPALYSPHPTAILTNKCLFVNLRQNKLKLDWLYSL